MQEAPVLTELPDESRQTSPAAEQESKQLQAIAAATANPVDFRAVPCNNALASTSPFRTGR